MALRISLRPNEKLIVNGCIIRNSSRRQMLIIENQADVIRECELLKSDQAATPVRQVFFFIQTAFLNPEIRETIIPIIQTKLGKLAPIFEERTAGHIIESANHVSAGDYYKALKSLRSVLEREKQILDLAKEDKISAQLAEAV
jgi:flagellar protein FlbT